MDHSKSKVVNIQEEYSLSGYNDFELFLLDYGINIEQDLRDIHRKIKVKIIYKSIYNETFTYYTNLYVDL